MDNEGRDTGQTCPCNQASRRDVIHGQNQCIAKSGNCKQYRLNLIFENMLVPECERDKYTAEPDREVA